MPEPLGKLLITIGSTSIVSPLERGPEIVSRNIGAGPILAIAGIFANFVVMINKLIHKKTVLVHTLQKIT